MKINKTLRNIVLASALTLGGISCANPPKLKKVADFTGDGINDVLVYEYNMGLWDDVIGDYLFIGQKDGSFIRTKEYEVNGAKYLKTDDDKIDDDKIYFFDGQFYRESPK